jgi:2-(1,2-epoxy-1,2-dihydrophenyl)acetyl-CoA isomerase
MTCDLIIASERAVVVPAFGRLGLIPEVGTSWALTRRLGYQGALAFYLRGEHIDAHTALRLGLVQQVVSHDELLDAADDWCSRVAEMPPHAMAMAKVLLRGAADASWNDARALADRRTIAEALAGPFEPHGDIHDTALTRERLRRR